MTENLSDMSPNGYIIINLEGLVANWNLLREKTAPGAECSAVLKANAYGAGLEQAATALRRAGCRTFFVALPQEGVRLRKVAPDATIYVLNGLYPGGEELYCEAMLRPVLGSKAELEDWGLFCRKRKVAIPSALHVDTGMNRLGVTMSEARWLANTPEMLSALDLKLVISHLACGDTPNAPQNQAQKQKFAEVAELFPQAKASLANSAGVLLGPDYHFDLVRPGIALFGGNPIPERPNPMATVASLHAMILQVRTVSPQETVGYGGQFTAAKPMRVATVSCGYADGFIRQAGSTDTTPGSVAYLGDIPCPVIGRVSMDVLAIDVSNCPQQTARRGVYVELLGEKASVDKAAQSAGTISYEFLTSLGRRFERRYFHSAAGKGL